MTSNTPRHPRIVSAACLALVAVVTTAAVRAPRPAPLITAATPIVPRLPRHEAVLPNPAPVAQVTPPTPEPAPSTAPRTPRVAQALPLDDTPAVKLTAVAPPGARRGSDTLSIDDIRKLIAAHHPSALTGDPDINTVTLIVDARGNYVTSVAESRPFIIGGGRGGRGRVGGGGDTAFSGAGLRGRVGGGGGAVQDSAEVKRVLDMVQAKLARLTGDTVIVRSQAPLIVVDGVVQRGEDSAKVAVLEAKPAATGSD